MKKKIPIVMMTTIACLIGFGCGDTDTPSAADSADSSADPENTDTDIANVETDADTAGFEVDGLLAPESALHDAEADVYLVSNINGSPGATDGNGFISKISPSGKVLELKWIDGAKEDVELNAPKGMGIYGDTLFVADITSVRKFNRISGSPEGAIEIPESTFLNDIAVDDNGGVYVSDSSADIVYAITESGNYTRFTTEDPLTSPNGLATDGNKLWVATDDKIICFDPEGKILSTLTPPDSFLDGLLILEDGRIVVSSWDGKSVYITSTTSEFQTLFSDLTGAADIGFDAKRSLVLMPMLSNDTFEVRRLP